MPFVEARKYACDLKLRSRTEWGKYTKSNSRNFLIPVNPDTVYKNSGWTNWGDFLGSGTIASQLVWRSVADIGWNAAIRIRTSTTAQSIKWHATDVYFERGRGL